MTMKPCGAECVYRWVEGFPADVRVCERTAGPCPHPEPARASYVGPYDRVTKERHHSAPCAADQERIEGADSGDSGGAE